MTSSKNNFNNPYSKNWQWVISFTSFLSATENDILHSTSSLSPDLEPIGTTWHPDLTISWIISGFGHAFLLHLPTNGDASGGQSSLNIHTAISALMIPLLNDAQGPCVRNRGEPEQIAAFKAEPDKYNLPLIMTIKSNDSAFCVVKICKKTISWLTRWIVENYKFRSIRKLITIPKNSEILEEYHKIYIRLLKSESFSSASSYLSFISMISLFWATICEVPTISHIASKTSLDKFSSKLLKMKNEKILITGLSTYLQTIEYRFSNVTFTLWRYPIIRLGQIFKLIWGVLYLHIH